VIHATRYHDISCGHRVVGHEGHCRLLHGHNYRIWFTCSPPMHILGEEWKEPLDSVGRVIDFNVMKDKLCMWLEENWDHKFLMWEKDPLRSILVENTDVEFSDIDLGIDKDLGIVLVPFNPTAENIGEYLISVIGPQQLKDTGVVLTRCIVEETRKCSAEVELGIYH
jgi:6-pyruvoyltetrahydropterin/6-carboxytetrahydropterin synthase